MSPGGEGWLGFPDLWSGQKLEWNWYLTPVVNFGEIQRAQLAKSTLLTSSMLPLWYFQIYSRSLQMLKREWGAESNGKLPHLFIPSKTTTLVPEFAVEDLPLGRTATLVPKFAVKDLPLGRTLWWWYAPSMKTPKSRPWPLEFVNERLRASHLPVLLCVTDLPLNKESAHVFSYPGLTYWTPSQGQRPRTLARPILSAPDGFLTEVFRVFSQS